MLGINWTSDPEAHYVSPLPSRKGRCNFNLKSFAPSVFPQNLWRVINMMQRGSKVLISDGGDDFDCRWFERYLVVPLFFGNLQLFPCLLRGCLTSRFGCPRSCKFQTTARGLESQLMSRLVAFEHYTTVNLFSCCEYYPYEIMTFFTCWYDWYFCRGEVSRRESPFKYMPYRSFVCGRRHQATPRDTSQTPARR